MEDCEIEQDHVKPYLSIIVPAYNEEQRLPQTLRNITSYVQDSGFAAEIIVVDDGSADDTARVVEEFAASHPIVHLIRNDHRGKACTVQTGMLAAKGQYVPLVKSFALSRKKGASSWVEYEIKSDMSYEFKVKTGSNLPEGLGGTVGRKGAQCIVTGSPIPLSYIRRKGKEGKINYRLMAIAAEGKRARSYFSPIAEHEQLAKSIQLDEYPSIPIEHWAGCTNCVVYGYENFEDLYTKRQLQALITFSDAIIAVKELVRKNFLEKCTDSLKERDAKADSYAKLVAAYLTFALDKMALPPLGQLRLVAPQARAAA